MSRLQDTINKAKAAKEPVTQPDGQYKLKLVSLKEKTGKDSGKDYLEIYQSIENPKNAPASSVKYMISYDDPEQTDEINAMRALQMQRFLKAYEIPFDKFVPEVFDSFKGRTAWAVLKEVDEGEFGMKNQVSRYVGSVE